YGTLAILILFLLSIWYVTNPKRISRLAETLLSNVLGGRVTVKSGHLSFSGTLLLSGVELQTDPVNGKSMPIFSADQIEARFDWASLLSGQLKATQLTAIHPTLYLVEDRDTERWNYERYRAPSSTEPSLPVPQVSTVKTPSLPVIVLREA